MNNEILLIFGRKRTRKTQLAISIMRERDRVFYIDPKAASRKRNEYAFGVECCTPEAVRDLTERKEKDGTPARFSVRVPVKDQEWMDLLCQQALHVENCTVGIDEIQRFSDPHHTNPGIIQILEDGGASAVSLVGVTHRPTDIQIDLTAAADRIITFQQTHISDIKRLQQYIEADDDVFRSLSAPSEEAPHRKSEYIEWRVDRAGYEIKDFTGDSRAIRGNADNQKTNAVEAMKEAKKRAKAIAAPGIPKKVRRICRGTYEVRFYA